MRGIKKIRTYKNYWFILKKFFPKRKHILIACFPKSGSTYLRELLVNLSKIEPVSLTTGYDRREQELSVEQLILFHGKNYVASHHTRYSTITQQLIDDFKISPIVLVRNIFDVIFSYHDHIHKEGVQAPFAFIPDKIINWDKKKSLEFIVDMIVPWYFNFYVSWTLCKNKLFVTYDDIIKNTHSTLIRIADFAEITNQESDIENLIQKTQKQNNIRKNVGISGRGNELPDELKAKIRKLANYYPDIDFSSIGI